MISVASVDDAPRAASLLVACQDECLVTVAGVRYGMANALPEDRMGHWRAERDGELIGWAFGGLDAFAPVRTTGFAGLLVYPGHRRTGVGSALWEALSAHLARIGARRVLAHSQADTDTMAFAAGRGFGLEGTHTASAVEPRTLGTPPPPPAGIELTPLSRFDDDPRPVYAADRESVVDEPGPADLSGMTYATWRRLICDHPDCDHALGSASLSGGAVVGATFLFADRESGRAANAGTGVIREFRGRGLGLLMKQHSLASAAAARITKVTTQNDESNAPMLAINAWLGYEPFATGHAWVLER